MSKDQPRRLIARSFNRADLARLRGDLDHLLRTLEKNGSDRIGVR
jgi:hypothetical protein